MVKLDTLKSIVMSVLIATSLSTVQAAEMVEDSGAWMQAVAEGSLGVVDPALQKGRIWLEAQSRFDGDWSHWYQGMVRTAIGYSLSDRATIWAGYTFLPSQILRHDANGNAIGNGQYRGQQDIWPGFRYVLPTDWGSFTFRSLWESNFIANEVRQRPRQMIRFMHPFEFEKRLSFIAWDILYFTSQITETITCETLASSIYIQAPRRYRPIRMPVGPAVETHSRRSVQVISGIHNWDTCYLN